MQKPYGIISDTHNHAWSQFAVINNDGVNSRLQITLDETLRAAALVSEAGGDTLYHAGDMFHVRGSIAPSVLNPTLDAYRAIQRDLGVRVVAIPGNHDLEGKESNLISNASTALCDVGVIIVPEIAEHGGVVMAPWMSSIEDLKAALPDYASSDKDLIIHAPVDGVIMGIPDHGLSPTWLSDLGFRNVFCGHYHNYKDFGGGVYSVGALTHQTWGDVNSQAGFILVEDGKVTHHESTAPSFVDLDLTNKSSGQLGKVDGNYVRVKTTSGDEKKLKKVREMLLDRGAAGVVIHAIRGDSTTLRTTATVKSGASVQQSINEFVKQKGYKNQKALLAECADVLGEVEVI